MLLALYVHLHTALVAPATRRLSSDRGVSMLEYALIAGVVIGIGLVLRNALGPAISGLFDRVRSFVDAG